MRRRAAAGRPPVSASRRSGNRRPRAASIRPCRSPFSDALVPPALRTAAHDPVTEQIAIDERHLSEKFIRASGPGGQNVNKVATAVELRFDAAGDPALEGAVFERLRRLAGRRMTSAGVIVITASTYRTQERNRAAAMARLLDLIRRAAATPKPRRATRPTAASRKKRRETKVRRSRIKRLRGAAPELDCPKSRPCTQMLFSELVATSRRVAETRSRLEKIAALAAALRRLAEDEIETGVAYLSGELRQGKIGIGSALLRERNRRRARSRRRPDGRRSRPAIRDPGGDHRRQVECGARPAPVAALLARHPRGAGFPAAAARRRTAPGRARGHHARRGRRGGRNCPPPTSAGRRCSPATSARSPGRR